MRIPNGPQPRTSLARQSVGNAGRSRVSDPPFHPGDPSCPRGRRMSGPIPARARAQHGIRSMTSTVPNHDSIALAAYFIWQDEGRPHGRHQDHWFAAEAGLTRGAAREAVEAAPAPARKAAPVRKPAAAKKAAPAKQAAAARTAKPAAPTAPAETVVAAAALAAPRAARTPSKGARNAH